MFFRKVVLALRFFFGVFWGVCVLGIEVRAREGRQTMNCLYVLVVFLVVVFWFFGLSAPEISTPEFAFSVR